MSNMSISKSQPRTYRKISPRTVAIFNAEEIAAGNGSAAVRNMESTRLSPASRAFRIRKKAKEESAIAFIDNALEQIAVDAVQRVGKMVNSVDERIATKNSHFVLEQVKGKAVVRTENKNLNITIESVLE